MAFLSLSQHLTAFRQSMVRNSGLGLRLTLALVCALASFGLGMAYADAIMISWLPILGWLFLIILVLMLLWPGGLKLPRSRSLLWLAPLLAVGFSLRAALLETLLPGLHVDEAGIADFAIRHVMPNLYQTISPFITGNNSQPAPYFYILRLFMALFGFRIGAIRLSSVLAGTLAIAAIFFLVDVFSGRRAAWYAALVMTAYHYPIHWSRLALNNIWVTLWVPLTLAFFVWGWRKRWPGGALLAGICLGLTAYFYQGGYLVVFLLLFVFWALWREGQARLALLMYFSQTMLMALVIAGPLIAFAIFVPEWYFARVNLIWGWSPETIALAFGPNADRIDYAWFQIQHSFGAFTVYSDATGFYDPGVPFVIGVASPLFLLGLIGAIFSKQYLPVVWVFLTAFFGGFLLSAPPGSSHYLVSVPAIVWLIALPLAGIHARGYRPLAYLLLSAVLAFDLYFYFVTYRADPSPDFSVPFPEVRPEYFQEGGFEYPALRLDVPGRYHLKI